MILPLSSTSAASRLPEFSMAAPNGQAPAAASGETFSSVLSTLAGSAIDTLRQGEAAALQGIEGNMPVQQVVDKVLSAERTLQTGLAIRDKLVGAFLEISRMQI
jgi:flagellar hook-basal body complex protein FliE